MGVRHPSSRQPPADKNGYQWFDTRRSQVHPTHYGARQTQNLKFTNKFDEEIEKLDFYFHAVVLFL